MASTLPEKIGATFDRSLYILFVIACILLAGILLSVCTNVVMRYLLRSPLRGIIELVEYALIYITFLSAAWILRLEKHVSIDFVTERVGPRWRALLKIVTSILAALVWLVVTWYSAEVTWELFKTGERVYTDISPLKWSLVAAIPIGGFLLFVQSVRWVYIYVRKWAASTE